MVSSAILCLLCQLGTSPSPRGLLAGVAAARGTYLFGERLLGLVEPAQDRAVVEIGADPDADPTDDLRIHIDLQRDLATVDVGQFGGQSLFLEVVERLGNR